MIRASLIAGLAGAIAGLGLAGAALGQRDVRSPAPVPAADYSKPDNWLCLPGRADACRVDQSATIVSASGSTRLEEFDLPRKDPAIDCFYVYPTVSNDPGDLSDLIPGPEERSVAAARSRPCTARSRWPRCARPWRCARPARRLCQ